MSGEYVAAPDVISTPDQMAAAAQAQAAAVQAGAQPAIPLWMWVAGGAALYFFVLRKK